MGNAVVRVDGAAFAVERALGDGGYSRVLLVRGRRGRRALKWARGLAGREELARARLELDVQRRLRHAHCLPLEAAEVRADRAAAAQGEEAVYEALLLFPVMPRGSLQAWLERAAAERRAAFSERECLRFFSLLLDAVHALHALGFAHRDIKPANVLLSSADPAEPVLMDFGSVAPLQRAVACSGDARNECEAAARLSSAAYRAPELWEAAGFRGSIDGRADVWSLGCVLHAMAFGPYSPFEHPREGVQPLAILGGAVSFEGEFADAYSPTFVALVRWVLTPAVAERPTLDGVRQCVRQLLAIPPAPMRRLSSAVPPAALVRQLSKQESWADFAAFDASASAEDSTRRESTGTKRASGAVRATEGPADESQRQRALSWTGRQLLARALGDAPSIT